jgi:hypothetical protein
MNMIHRFLNQDANGAAPTPLSSLALCAFIASGTIPGATPAGKVLANGVIEEVLNFAQRNGSAHCDAVAARLSGCVIGSDALLELLEAACADVGDDVVRQAFDRAVSIAAQQEQA